jgi:hypothetical protein
LRDGKYRAQGPHTQVSTGCALGLAHKRAHAAGRDAPLRSFDHAYPGRGRGCRFLVVPSSEELEELVAGADALQAAIRDIVSARLRTPKMSDLVGNLSDLIARFVGLR